MRRARLITIQFSHYCDKARWGLQRAKIEFDEEAHAPMLSWAATLGSGGTRTAPVLVTGDQVLSDSTDILRHADAQGSADPLFPPGNDEAARLEDRFDRVLGPATRRCAYDLVLRMPPPVVSELLGSGAPAWERAIARAAPGVFIAMLRRGLRIVPEQVARSRAAVATIFDEVATLLADDRPYLTGDRFTAADLTFAALATPVVYPDAYAKTALPLDRLSDDVRASVDAHRATTAGQFAMRLYARDRG
jgi:glutathione S-transferase